MKFRVVGSPLHHLEQSGMMITDQEEEVKGGDIQSQSRRESELRRQQSMPVPASTSQVVFNSSDPSLGEHSAAMHQSSEVHEAAGGTVVSEDLKDYF